MRAAIYERYGPSSVLTVQKVPKAHAGPGDCLIKVAGAGLNPVDAKLRSGSLDGIFPLSFPVIPGWDVSGTVEAVGEGVDASWIGKQVYGYVRYDSVAQQGTCAEYCAAPVDFFAEIPSNIDLAMAAAVPLVALTAYQSLVEQAGIQAGQNVLILAGGGAVGKFAIQIAKAAGANVVTTASPADHAKLRDLGAGLCVDYRASDWAARAGAHAPGGYDVILDGVGGQTLTKCYDLLAHDGCLIGLNDPPDDTKIGAAAKAVRLFSRPEGEQLAAITAQIASGALVLDNCETMPLDDVANAHALLDKGHKRKIVLVP